jgi:drug/metabolite transporter (DMT)-like permease
MTDRALATFSITISNKAMGVICGMLGVVIFSGSLPATRLAVADLDPVFVTAARAVIAAILGGLLLAALRIKRPQRGDLLPLLGVMCGVVVGWPLMIALSLKIIPSSHGTIYIGLLPLMTAIFGVFRGGERPKPQFWLFASIGSALVVAYALAVNGFSLAKPDLMMLAGVAICGYGYAEGAQLSKRLGGWQVISWALLAGLPIMLAVTYLYWPQDLGSVHAASWMGLAYAGVFAMLIGFVFWYKGLAIGGTASVGQLQLLQPFFSFIIAAAFLGETVTWQMIAVTLGVVACVTAARRNA